MQFVLFDLWSNVERRRKKTRPVREFLVLGPVHGQKCIEQYDILLSSEVAAEDEWMKKTSIWYRSPKS